MTRILDYVGAGARLDPSRGLVLPGRHWAWQPKVDGCYARVSTDSRGAVVRVLSRTGAELATDLLGCLTGAPLATLHGEVEAHTEAGLRAVATRGWSVCHLFDATSIAGTSLAHLPYSERRAALFRAQAQADQVSPWERDGQGDHHDATGRYCRPVPRDHRRFPVVPQVQGHAGARDLWRQHVELGGGEGLVAVRLDAPARARGAKRKIKATDDLTCTVVEASGGAALLAYASVRFAVAAGRWHLEPGQLVDVACDGWYETATAPRFARITRVRVDLH